MEGIDTGNVISTGLGLLAGDGIDLKPGQYTRCEQRLRVSC